MERDSATFFNKGKVCPFVDIGCKFQHQVSTLCKFQRCKNNVCQYEQYIRNITVEDNDGNKAVIDLDKGCDEVLARNEETHNIKTNIFSVTHS